MKIKYPNYIVWLLITSLALILAGPAAAQKYYKDIKFPKLHEIKIPKVERFELKNGMILFLVEDHELPLINLSARIGVGSIYEPEDKIGLASLTGQVMRTGGTTSMSGDEIDEELERIAASVETSIGLTSGSASMSVLKKDLDKGLSILADILMHPAFPQEKLDLAKIQARTAIARRNDEPFGITFREFRKLIYGADSPYSRHTEYATIDAITRQDLIAFHKQFFHPNNVIIGVWGDFKTKDMIKKIERAFSEWKPVEFERPQIPEVKYNYDLSINLIKKEDINQSHLIMGHIGGLRNNPDYFALIVLNNILGSSFTGRLFKNVRSRMGLAYSVFGSYSANYDYPGMFYVGCQTKGETTIEALNAMRNEVEKMTKELVTDEELAQAKDIYLNSFVFNFDTKGEIVNRIMTYEYYGYPKDFLEKTKEKIEKVTKEDVLRVAKKYLQPEKLRILAVGNPELFDQPLSNLGEVREIDITIPEIEVKVPEATEATLKKGKELLNKAITACGGTSAFKAIKTLQLKGNVNAIMPQGEMAMAVQVTMAMPDRFRSNINTPMGEISQIMNGDQAWLVSPQGTMPAPARMKEQMISNLWHNIVYLFTHANSEGLTAQYLGSEEVEGQKSEVVLITPQGVKSFKLYLQAESMIPIMMSYQGLNMMGAPVASEEMFSDFREVNGIKLPFKTMTNQDGKKAQEAMTLEILINVEVDESQFSVK
ncbi:MAG: M16 family metallopeptidase [bacterium]